MSLSFIYPQFLWLLLLVPFCVVLGMAGRRRNQRARLWSALGLRALLMIAIILALSGILLRLRSDTLTTVFILDFSDSIPKTEQSRGEALIRQMIQEMPPGDKAAVVVFGEDALVERLASEDYFLSDLASIPISIRTNIASALQLAQAILPGEGAKRLVLMTDGQQNLGEAIEQAELAASQNIELLYVPLGRPQGEVEVFLEGLDAPSEVRLGESFSLTVLIQSNAPGKATLRIFENDALIQSREIRLQSGMNRQRFEIEAHLPEQNSESPSQNSFRRFRAQIIPDADTRLQNNQASAFTVVHGPPEVLIIEGQPGEGENLARALKAAEMKVIQASPISLPTTLAELAAFDAVILINVHASALPSGFMQTLQTYVRDLGLGLVMVGGKDSFGAGGYLRTPIEEVLPVDMDVKNKDLQANLALVLAIDKSGSMGRCHCDNPDLNQSYTRSEAGQPKVDIAKEAIMRSANALGNQDYLGVVAFDSQPRWVLNPGKLVDPLTLEQAISSFQAEGQTNLQAGVQTAYQALQDIPAERKHIILMTDGWVRQGDLTGLAQEMQDQGITLSIVAAGEGSAEYLRMLSDMGGGSFYQAVDTLSVPDIFLKETIKSVGEYIVEEVFTPLPALPSPILRNLDMAAIPPLLGYNGTSSKKTARLDLITPRGDPLLATWQYGLGRSAAWTSDFKGQWGIEWLEWESFSRFASQLVGWVLPAPKVEGFTAKASLKDNQAVIQLEALDKNGLPLNFLQGTAVIVDPALHAIEIPLKQTGAGKYQASINVSNPGTYLVRLGVNHKDQSLGQLTLGFVIPYSPEYKSSGVDRKLLGELANITGGGELTNPGEVFVHNLPAAHSAREIWQPLLLMVALLFPLDVAIRRLNIGPQDLRKARAWLHSRLPKSRAKRISAPTVLGHLFQARERARQRFTSTPEVFTDLESREPKPGYRQTTEEPPDATVETGKPPQTTESPPGDSLARLREAKKRARR